MSGASGAPVVDWCTDWDHADPAWAADPFTIWDRLRVACPVARTERYGGAWLVTSGELIDQVAHDTTRFSSRDVALRPGGVHNDKPPMTTDPPLHNEYRRVLLRHFAPKAIARLESGLRAYCRELIGAIGDASHFDAVEAYTKHIPSWVIAGLLELPEGDTEQFRRWVRVIMEQGHVDPAARNGAVEDLKAYLRPVLRARRERPGSDLLSAVVQAAPFGEALSEEQALGVAYLLVVAGIDTTWSALGTIIWYLGTHPAALAALCEDPSTVPAAVEELLRLFAPVSVARVVVSDTDLGGCALRQGERVLLPFGSANRDPARHERPAEYLIDRPESHHASFGLGVHRCLGSNLARLELQVATAEWVAAFPRFRIRDHASVTWTLGHVRGPHSLPIEVTVPGSLDPQASTRNATVVDIT